MTLINDGRPFRSRDASDHFGSHRDLDDAVRIGAIRWIGRSIAVDARVPDSRAVRAQAARLVIPDHAVAADDYAAFVLGAHTDPPGRRWDFRPTYLVGHQRYVSRPGYAVVRQTNSLPEDDVMEVDGLRLTTPLRTAADLLRRPGRAHALASADAMARAGLFAIPDLQEYVASLSWLPRLRQAQELAVRVTVDAESPGESWQRCRILDAGFPMPVLQHKVVDSYGIERRLDMAYPVFRAASEYDGREFHTASSDRELDESRRGDLSLRLGWRFSLGTYERIFGTNTAFEDELGSFLRLPPRPRTWF
jgi:hypothetical protein